MLTPDVFDETIVPGLRTASIFSNKPFLISNLSTITSIIQSTSFSFSKSSSKLPGVINARFFSMKVVLVFALVIFALPKLQNGFSQVLNQVLTP